MGTVRAQNLSVSDIFKRHRKPLLVTPEGNRFLSCPRPYCGSLRLQHRHRVGTSEPSTDHIGGDPCRRPFPLITEHAGVRSLVIAAFRFALVPRLERVLFRRSVEVEE